MHSMRVRGGNVVTTWCKSDVFPKRDTEKPEEVREAGRSECPLGKSIFALAARGISRVGRTSIDFENLVRRTVMSKDGLAARTDFQAAPAAQDRRLAGFDFHL